MQFQVRVVVLAPSPIFTTISCMVLDTQRHSLGEQTDESNFSSIVQNSACGGRAALTQSDVWRNIHVYVTWACVILVGRVGRSVTCAILAQVAETSTIWHPPSTDLKIPKLQQFQVRVVVLAPSPIFTTISCMVLDTQRHSLGEQTDESNFSSIVQNSACGGRAALTQSDVEKYTSMNGQIPSIGRIFSSTVLSMISDHWKNPIYEWDYDINAFQPNLSNPNVQPHVTANSAYLFSFFGPGRFGKGCRAEFWRGQRRVDVQPPKAQRNMSLFSEQHWCNASWAILPILH